MMTHTVYKSRDGLADSLVLGYFHGRNKVL